MSDASKLSLSSEARRARSAERAEQAKSGWVEYRARQDAVAENSARLRALRLEMEAKRAEEAATEAASAPKAKPVRRSRARPKGA